MLRTLRKTAAVAIGAVGFAAAAVTGAAAQVDFAGKTITIVAPFAPGGGGDLWTRLVAPHLARHLPGEPTIIIENIPGGGQITGANHFQQVAKPDGLWLFSVSTSMFFSYSLNPTDPKIQFKPAGWQAIVSSPIGSVIYVNNHAGIKEATELNGLEAGKIVLPVSSPTGSDIRTLLTLDMLGTEARPVVGLDGSESNLAFMRGELNAGRETAGTFKQVFQPMVDKGEVVPLFTLGFPDASGEIARDPEFPDLPHFAEVYKTIHGKDPSGPEYDVWKIFFYSGVMNSKGLVLPEGTPKEIYDTYVKALEEMAADPVFIEAAKVELGGYPLVIGEASQKSWENAITMSDETRAWVQDWLKRRFNL